MRTRIMSLLVALVAISGLAFAAPVIAQDAMATHTCDSTLIVLLYVAEHDYGFHSTLDVASFDKGQYGPLFDAMMAMTDEDAMMEGDAMMATEEAMMEEDGMMEGATTTLAPGHIAGEDPACTELRTELDAFAYGLLTAGTMMEESGG
jgi:hypothetical protein